MSRISRFFTHGPTQYFQPTPVLRNRTQDAQELQDRLALLVGLVAAGLPSVMLLGVWVGGTCFRYSISHFYYAQFLGPIFVGMLAFIGFFLIVYSGESAFEKWGSLGAGLGAWFVAMMPTTDSGCLSTTSYLARVFVEVVPGADGGGSVQPHPDRGFFELFANVQNWHGLGAGLVLGFLGLYCLLVLKRVVEERHICDGQLRPTKRRRNTLYTCCGLTILICIAILGVLTLPRFATFKAEIWNTHKLTFVLETIALWAFALAWLVKGRSYGTGWLNEKAA